MNHYIIYRNLIHPDAYFACAPTAREAMRNYALQTFAAEDSNGLLKLNLPGKRKQTFSCELEAIECCEKAVAQTWSMQLVPPDNWGLKIADSFCGYNPGDIDWYVNLCRNRFGESSNLPSGSFVWYMKVGVLVTFFQPRRGKIILPTDIKVRILIRWTNSGHPEEWTGDYEQLLSEMAF
jgi:hypothetical protein